MSNATKESRRTVYPGPQVFHLWANGCTRDLRGGNVSTANGGATLYSYRAPIAHRMTLPDAHPRHAMSVFLLRAPFYSKTTGKHIGKAWSAVPNARRLVYPEGFYWDGAESFTHPDGLSPALSIYDLPLSPCAVPGSFIFHGVTCVNPDGFGTHRGNYAALHAAALRPLERLRTARKYGTPNAIALDLARADFYRATFIPHEPRLPIPAEAPAIVAAWRKRIAASEARAEAEAVRVKRERAEWLAAHANILAAVKRKANEARAASDIPMPLAEKIRAWEAGNAWPADNSSEPEAVDQLRRIVRALIRGEHSLIEASPDVPSDIKAALPPYFRFSDPRLNALAGGESAAWEAASISPFLWNAGSVHDRATRAAHRHLIRLSADGSEVITSGGARVPASIARILWKRHGALMREAVTAASVPAFPGDGSPIPFGPFAWTGWIEADENARAAGAGAWLLRVGCHLISPADLCRMAKRAKWEGGCHA